MKYLKINLIAIIAALLVLAAVKIGVDGLVAFKQGDSGGIAATGSASMNFDSDLIVWRGYFSQFAPTTKDAFDALKLDAEKIKSYLLKKGVLEEEIVFSSVDISKNWSYEYNDAGYIKNEIFSGYTLTQNLTIESSNVDLIESISRDITQLIDAGVELISNPPEYYYTKLDSMKLDLIAEATANAYERVSLIAENSKSTIGDLVSANLGVFQITAQNSSLDEYSSGGTYNTWSRHKTAAITVKLSYKLK